MAIPNAEWTLVDEGPADLTLRHRGWAAGMAVNAVCEGAARRRSAGVLVRQLQIGLRDRRTIERARVEIAGRAASRTVIEGRLEDSTARVRVESLAMTDERCLYDLLYVAPPATFEAARADFARFVDSFRTE